jgi:hypothetical protein
MESTEQVQEVMQEMTIDDVIEGLQGFGIIENEEPIVMTIGGRKVALSFTNIPIEQDVQAAMACEELKGHAWIQQVRCELLSRAVSRIDGIEIRKLPPEQRFITNPKTNEKQDIQVVLRDVLMSWACEPLAVLWKLLMVHQQKIEDDLMESFPQSATMTKVEERILKQALDVIEELNRQAISEQYDKTYEEEMAKAPETQE